MKIAVIGGSGYDNFPAMKKVKAKKIKTPYGNVSIKVGKYKGKVICFLPRHGADYSIPPHRINNRANIDALRKEGVDYILATAACGAINKKMKPGDLVIITDFIDFTMNRIETFNLYREPVFTDVSVPYNKNLRDKLLKAGKELKIKIHQKATYICTEGPRFESPAEIKAFGKLGADIVGMTNVPECVLAN
ncbi:MAG: MTAP family purine nucleoside phosphorylase, partial [Candidatus Saganbacteria bacterium]|nr:MTAP family purine nucleoside phosphorylase [Candidatus Saganbacteria bacterium]